MNWFNVDKKGLAKLMEGRSKAFVLYELLQNAWDQKTTVVNVTITPIRCVPMTEITVEDNDPDGFSDLAHAYTLFAESQKKEEATKRGRFNIGEKLVLALAREAVIETKRGAVRFDVDGRHEIRSKRIVGSKITISLPMTREEHGEVLEAAQRVIVPDGVKTTINGEVLRPRKPIASFETTLPTLIAKDGVMRTTNRKTAINVYEPAAGEVATLYEMGIPVVETGDRFHIDVQQKVPLNMDRDNVTPAYLRTVRVVVLNAVHDQLEEGDVTETWVKEACGDDRVSSAAVRQTMKLRFGKNAVAYDPSDPEANKLAVAEGRQVIYGGNLSGSEWEQVRKAGVLKPAGVVTPSPKPYSEDGRPLNVIPVEEWTRGMVRFAEFAKMAARELIHNEIVVSIVREFGWNYDATFGATGLVVNLMRVGHKFFERFPSEDQLSLLIHEFGHHYTGDHLSAEYYAVLSKLGARLALLALRDPKQFDE